MCLSKKKRLYQFKFIDAQNCIPIDRQNALGLGVFFLFNFLSRPFFPSYYIAVNDIYVKYL